MTLNIGTLVGYLELNDTQLNRKADAATKKIDGLMLQLNALSKNNPKLDITVQTRQLEEAKAEIEALKAEGAKGIDVNVRMVAALAKLDALQTKLREMHNAEIRLHIDDKQAIDRLEAIQKRIDGIGSKGGLLGSALAFGPAFLPALNALPGTLFAVGSGAVASASGVGVLALAFHGLGDAVKAYQDYEAKLPFAKNAKQIAELKKQLSLSAYGEQNTSGRTFTRLVATKGSAAASGIKESAQAGVFPGATRALRDIMPLVPVVEHLMKSLGTTVGNMTDETAKALNSPFWRQWFHWLGEDAKTQLPLVGSIFGHFFQGIMRAIQRFSPEGTSVLQWFDDLAKRFDSWTGSPAFETFIENTAKNGHAAVDALRPFGQVIGELYKGLSGAGLVELKVFGAVMTGISHLPVGVLQAIGTALPLIFLGLKGIALTNGITSGLTTLGGVFTGLQGKISGTAEEASNTKKAIAGLAGAGGLALLTMATQQSSQAMAGLEGAAGGAMIGFQLGGPWGAGILAIGGLLLGIFSSGHSAADGIRAATKAALESRTAIDGYKSSLDGLNANATTQTRKDILGNIADARGTQKNGPNKGDPGILASIQASDTVIMNAVLGRGKASSILFKEIEGPLVAVDKQINSTQTKIATLQQRIKDHHGMDLGAQAELVKQQNILDTLKDREVVAHSLEAQQTKFINDLQEAQRELRKTNAEALTFQERVKMGVPKPIAHLIDTQGVDQDVRAVAALIDRFHVVDKTKWKAILSAEGLVPSRDMLQQIQGLLNDAARSRTAKLTLKIAGDVGMAAALGAFGGSSKKVKIGPPTAAGGTVAGQRSPYGDKVLTPTAPGEEIVSNSHGQADRNRAALKAANAGATLAIVGRAMAGGGTVGDPLAGFSGSSYQAATASHGKGGKGKTTKATKAKQKAARDRRLRADLAAVTKALTGTQKQISEAQDWSSTFGGNAFSADLSPYMKTKGSPITSIINGMKVVQSGGAIAQTPQSTLMAMLAYEKAQNSQARKLSGWVAKLRKEGVSSSLLDQIKSAGPEGVAKIQALASGSLAQVKEFNSLNSSTGGLLNETGALATSGKHYSTLQREQLAEKTTINAINKALKKPVAVRVVNSGIRP